jgi:hypothetical protein
VLSNNDACCGPNVLSDKWDLGMSSSRGHETLGGPSHHDLVQAAVLAPSPDNNQPWRFEPRGDELRVYADPTRAIPSDVQGMFDLLGIGAAIENMCIAAREQGFEPNVSLSSDETTRDAPNEPALVATLTFEPGEARDPLFPQLASRCTNRKLYAKNSPSDAVLERLAEAGGAFDEIHIDWIRDRVRIDAMARLIAATDLIRFEYEPFHRELFRQLRFSVNEAEQARDGLDLRTLELPPGVGVALRGLRSWSVMKWLHRSGLGRLLTVPSGVGIRRSGALGVISASEACARCFVDGGRAFERLWLQADKEGLALQPLGSPSIFFAHLEVLEGKKLTDKHKRQVGKQLIRLHELVPPTRGRAVLIAFRLGESSRPKYRSLRRPAKCVLYLPGKRLD